MSKLYIDGSKIESQDRKKSFVWKKAILKHRDKLYLRITKSIAEKNGCIPTTDMFMPRGKYVPREVRVYIDYHSLLIQKHNILFIHVKGSKKKPYQRYYKTCIAYEEKLIKHQIQLQICGKKYSYSKTNHDATFMNIKYDYYNRTGVFRPGYYLQVGVSDYYIVYLWLYPNPTDITNALKDILRETLQDRMDAEFQQHMGYEKHDQIQEKSKYRNSSSEKTVKTSQGQIDLSIPRDRNATFDPVVVEKHIRDIPDVDAKIMNLYVKGMSTRGSSDTVWISMAFKLVLV